MTAPTRFRSVQFNRPFPYGRALFGFDTRAHARIWPLKFDTFLVGPINSYRVKVLVLHPERK
jgi:hypothetical protein